MSLLKKIVGLIPKNASREERMLYAELAKGIDAGIQTNAGQNSSGGDSSVYETLSGLGLPVTDNGDIAVAFPTKPTGFTASGAFNNVVLEWDAPQYSGHAYTEVYRAQTNSLTEAKENGLWMRSYPSVINDAVDSGSTYYYWIRHINVIGQAGPFNSTVGTKGETSQSVEQLIQDAEQAAGIDPTPFFVYDGNVYMKNAYIKDLTADNLAAGAVTADKISVVDLSAVSANMGTVVAYSANIAEGAVGSLQIADYIQSDNYVALSSGWRIDKSGNAVFNSASIRGTVQSFNFSPGISGWKLSSNGDAEVNKLTLRDPIIDGALQKTYVFSGIVPNSFYGENCSGLAIIKTRLKQFTISGSSYNSQKLRLSIKAIALKWIEIKINGITAYTSAGNPAQERFYNTIGMSIVEHITPQEYLGDVTVEVFAAEYALYGSCSESSDYQSTWPSFWAEIVAHGVA